MRAALVSCFFAQRRLASLRQEEQVRAEMVRIFEKRVALGEASNPELYAARAEQAAALVGLRTAEGETAQSLAALAAATGLPLSALEGRAVDPGNF